MLPPFSNKRKQRPQQQVPVTWTQVVPMPLPSSGAGLHRQLGCSNAQLPQQHHQPPEPTEPLSTNHEHGAGGGGQWCSRVVVGQAGR